MEDARRVAYACVHGRTCVRVRTVPCPTMRAHEGICPLLPTIVRIYVYMSAHIYTHTHEATQT